MYAYHYWKCYHKEGAMFQTASLYSIEVDYYKFGTCEMAGGSYFCGDHSCNTFKYVGEKVHGETGKTVYEQPAIGSAMLTAAGKGEGVTITGSSSTYTPPVPGYTDPSGLYHSGDGNVHGNRDDSNGVASNLPVLHSPFTQVDQSGYLLRGDAATSYHLYDGYKAGAAAMVTATGLYSVDTTKQHHLTETIVAGACKAKCDADISCRAFQENRWQQMHLPAKCTTFHFGSWVHETNLTSNLTPNQPWDFYAKYAQAKNPTWLHAPIKTGYSPTTSGMGSPKFAGYQGGRRLEGVY